VEIEQHHGSMLARGLVVLVNLGICEAHPVLAVTAGTALHDSGDHLDNRQDLPAGGVWLFSTFYLGHPRVQRAGPEPTERRGTRSRRHSPRGDNAETPHDHPAAVSLETS